MSRSFQVSLGDSEFALAEAPFPTAADGKWHRVGLTAHQNEALRLSWDGSDGLGTDVVPSSAAGGGLRSHEHLAFMPNAHIDFGEPKLATELVYVQHDQCVHLLQAPRRKVGCA